MCVDVMGKSSRTVSVDLTLRSNGSSVLLYREIEREQCLLM
jgi:hypothetical protein